MDIKVAVNVPAGLMKHLSGIKKAALAFSGGADSVYLMYAAKRSGMDVHAYYVNTQFQPRFELEDAKRAARKIGVAMTVIKFDVLKNASIRANPPERCYICKREIFSKIIRVAVKDGYRVIMDGTNASDDEGGRPGMRAVRELKVVSPLRDCGITKDKVREYSKTAGLFTWNKPAYACLATRVAAGVAYSDGVLADIEAAEKFLMDRGFSDFRVRFDGRQAKLQFSQCDWEKAARERAAVYKGLGCFFDDIVMDMRLR